MKISINGEEQVLHLGESPPTIKTVIKLLNHDPRLIVVEHNAKILPPNKWEDEPVKDGDTLEIVTSVGGGS